MKNKEVVILEFGTFWPLFVELILEAVGDRGNPSKYNQKLSTKSIQRKKKQIKTIASKYAKFQNLRCF